METIIAYILASPEIVGSFIVWLVGSIFHVITGTPLTVADAASCLLEGEFTKAGHYVVDEFGSAVKDKITSGSGIVSGALANVASGTITAGITEMADAKIDQIAEGLTAGIACPGVPR